MTGHSGGSAAHKRHYFGGSADVFSTSKFSYVGTFSDESDTLSGSFKAPMPF